MWLTSNLTERVTNRAVDFEVSMHLEPTDTKFHDACVNVCDHIKSLNRRVYVGVSGGIDSEFVLRTLMKNGIKPIGVTVRSIHNMEETSLTQKIYEELLIDHVCIDLTEEEFISVAYSEIYKKLNGIGFGYVYPIVAAKYAEDNNGIFIKSEHCMGDHLNDNGIPNIEFNEWDFYSNILNTNTIDFFLYNSEICMSLIEEMKQNKEDSVQKFKCKLYELPYRDKIRQRFDAGLIRNLYHHIAQTESHFPKRSYTIPYGGQV